MSSLKLALACLFFASALIGMVFITIAIIVEMDLCPIDPVKNTVPTPLSGRPSNTQSNLEVPIMSDGPEESIVQKFNYSPPEDCITLDEVKEILRLKASQRRTK